MIYNNPEHCPLPEKRERSPPHTGEKGQKGRNERENARFTKNSVTLQSSRTEN